jgi:D-glycero-D-manno-heptose 1,7-bisphosphate phosphatase
VTDRRLSDGIGLWCEVRHTFAGKPALFLDRDGVVIEDRRYVGQPQDVHLLAGVAAAIARCNTAGIPVVLVTNQSGIGRGFYGWPDFEAVQRVMEQALSEQGAHLDGVFACAYHKGGRSPYDVADHPWRKPGPGMMLEAAERLGLDLGGSWIVGDKADDLAAGRAAGLSGGILVTSQYGDVQAQRAHALASAGFRILAFTDLAAAATHLVSALTEGH